MSTSCTTHSSTVVGGPCYKLAVVTEYPRVHQVVEYIQATDLTLDIFRMGHTKFASGRLRLSPCHFFPAVCNETLNGGTGDGHN